MTSEFVVLSNGVVDVEASMQKFSAALSSFMLESELAASQIGVAVHAVFDANLGKRLPTPVVRSLALQQLNVQPENYKALDARVADYLHNEVAAGILSVTKGKGGGLARVSDLPVAAPAA